MPTTAETSADLLSRRDWDVVVVGTGVGGATIGYELARRGHSVLFLERGRLQAPGPHRVPGGEQESLQEGWWPAPLSHHDESGAHTFPHPLGCGTGGSSAIFSMVMERFRPEDFQPRRFFARAAASSLPETWPIGYAELTDDYRDAEMLYRVRGTEDPLFAGQTACLAPPVRSARERMLFDCLEASGLHPYRIHSACERVAGCDGCRDRICSRGCRNDAHRSCVVPALTRFDAALVSECRVDRLEHHRGRVTRVLANRGARQLAFAGRTVVLAANSFVTPLILLRSRGAGFPSGLANRSGLVGRNLMLHASDIVRVRPRGLARCRAPARGLMTHGIGLNDFYHRDGVKYGNIHAHPPVPSSLEGLQEYIARRYPQVGRRAPWIVRSVARAVAASRADTIAFATIVEDLPYADNRILPEHSSGDRVAYAYHVRDELRERAATLLRQFTEATRRRLRAAPIGRVGNLNRSHACGTVRFGCDPAMSVLDASNRAHDVDNLYVVDASFFPSSGGINPSLTIAANALRVGRLLSHAL